MIYRSITQVTRSCVLTSGIIYVYDRLPKKPSMIISFQFPFHDHYCSDISEKHIYTCYNHFSTYSSAT